MTIRTPIFVSDKALAVGPDALSPAASTLPLRGQPPRELDVIDTEFVSRKALAAGSSGNGQSKTPAASALPLRGQPPRELDVIYTEFASRKALAAGSSGNRQPKTPAASALPLRGQPPGELDEIDTEFVSRKALAAGSLAGVTDWIVAMIGELSQ